MAIYDDHLDTLTEYRLSSPHIRTLKAQTHAQTHKQAAGRSKHELTEPTVHYITDLVKNEDALFFVSVLKSGEPAPLTSFGGRQHSLADPLSKRCFETTLRNTSHTVLRIFTYRRYRRRDGGTIELLIEEKSK